MEVDVEAVRDTARGFVRKIGNNWNVPIPNHTLGDIADMAVAETIHVYNSEKGSFGNLLWYYCMGEIRKFIRFELRETASPFEIPIPETEVEFEPEVVAREILSRLVTKLGEQELRVLAGMATDTDMRDVAKALRTSPSQVYRMQHRMRAILKESCYC